MYTRLTAPKRNIRLACAQGIETAWRISSAEIESDALSRKRASLITGSDAGAFPFTRSHSFTERTPGPRPAPPQLVGGPANAGRARRQASRSATRIDVTANGEVEGPPRSADQAPRGHAVSPRPRRVTTYRSRSPPTIVRRPSQAASTSSRVSQLGHWNSQNCSLPVPEPAVRPEPASLLRY